MCGSCVAVRANACLAGVIWLLGVSGGFWKLGACTFDFRGEGGNRGFTEQLAQPLSVWALG